MRDIGQGKTYSSAVFLAVCTGLFCLLMLLSVVWLGRTGVGRRPENLPVLKISIPSETKVSKYCKNPKIWTPEKNCCNYPEILTAVNFPFSNAC